MLLASLALVVTSASAQVYVNTSSIPDSGAVENQLPPTSAGSVLGLGVDRSGANLLLSWNADCGLGDTYGIYRGDLALGYASIAADTCDVAVTQATIPVGTPDGEFFLVVPAWNGQEGFYGSSTPGDRLPATSSCYPQGPVDTCTACAALCDAGETCFPVAGCVVDFLVESDSIFFVSGLVSELWLFVAPEWMFTDDVSLAIDITGINGGFRLHGAQEDLVSSTQFIGGDQNISVISVAWTSDTNLTHSPETYTVCVQAMVDGQAFGDENCTAYGPF